ncbi:MAG TPA: hemolysin III family protein, partial [Acidimicrobiales bacterium]|nr:hemolysin III family protein [Acidimicrobiales bacterium]
MPTACLLIAHAAGTPAEEFVSLYAVSLVVLYAVSASYHLLPMSAGARWWMRRVDHANIYVFIAACYTPYCGLAV